MAYLDFKSFGGKFKAVPKPVRNIPGHFMNLLHKKHVRLLSHYLPEQPVTPDMLKQWQIRVSAVASPTSTHFWHSTSPWQMSLLYPT
eukprot:gene28860-37870_t